MVMKYSANCAAVVVLREETGPLLTTRVARDRPCFRHAGIPIHAGRQGVRALWLERIRYFLYYVEADDTAVEILALWHGSRGSRPRL